MTYTLYNEDCLTRLKQIPDNSIDCVVTSPPYNIGIAYNTYKDKRKDYHTWMNEIFIEIARIVKPNGHFFLNIGPTRKEPTLPYTLAQQVPMKIQNSIIWAKAIEIDNAIRGHGQVCNTDRYLARGWEMVWHFTHDGKQPVSLRVPYQQEWMEYNYKKTGRRDRPTTDCWHISYETTGAWGKDANKIKGDIKHPAIFPADLVKHCIDMCNPQTVLDPFAGTGTVGYVAKQMGIDATLIELDSEYCEFIHTRMK